jgi:predicted HicB family RNase H-like nuclease
MADGRGALILNEILPEEVREALDKEAKEENVTLNDVAAAILSEHFDVEWTPSGRPYRKMAEQFKLRVPEHLHWKIRMSAALAGHTVRGTVLATIAEHYGLPSITPTRRPRRQTA